MCSLHEEGGLLTQRSSLLSLASSCFSFGKTLAILVMLVMLAILDRATHVRVVALVVHSVPEPVAGDEQKDAFLCHGRPFHDMF